MLIYSWKMKLFKNVNVKVTVNIIHIRKCIWKAINTKKNPTKLYIGYMHWDINNPASFYGDNCCLCLQLISNKLFIINKVN